MQPFFFKLENMEVGMLTVLWCKNERILLTNDKVIVDALN